MRAAMPTPERSPNLPRNRSIGHDGLGHRAVAAGAADVAEVRLHELAGVPRVAEVAHAHDELAVDDAGDDRPLDVLDLQEEVGGVGDEVLARRSRRGTRRTPGCAGGSSPSARVTYSSRSSVISAPSILRISAASASG